MAMMTQAAVERRFLDPAAIQLKYRLARRHHPRPVHISAEIYGGGTVSATVSVASPCPRFPRWPMQLLTLFGRWASSKLLDQLLEWLELLLDHMFRRLRHGGRWLLTSPHA